VSLIQSVPGSTTVQTIAESFARKVARRQGRVDYWRSILHHPVILHGQVYRVQITLQVIATDDLEPPPYVLPEAPP